jgi:hypothetical protein
MLKIVATALFMAWIAALIFGKSGLYHILLLCAVGVTFVEAISILRAAEKKQQISNSH